MTADQQKRVEEIRAREQQAEVERLKNAIWPGLPKFVFTPETPQQDFHEAVMESLRVQHELDKDELEVLRKAVNLTLGFMDCCDWNDGDSERDAARVVSACRDAIGAAASESQAQDVAATSATEKEKNNG